MNLKVYSGLVVLALLIMSLHILHPAQAQNSSNELGPNFSPILIDSPVNTTYTTNHVCLNVTAKTIVNINQVNVTITYSIDNSDNVTIPTTTTFTPLEYIDKDGNTKVSGIFTPYLISGTVELENLQQGSHSLTVSVWYEAHTTPSRTGFDSQTIYFTIDTDEDTANNEPEYEPPINTVYAFAGILSLVAIVAFALLAKRNAREKCKVTQV